MRPLRKHHFIITLLLLGICLTAGLLYVLPNASQSSASSSKPEPETVTIKEEPLPVRDFAVVETETFEPMAAWPISRATERITKKEFGQLIEAGHSPVPGDRFSGYHVGVDFEIFEGEEDEVVMIQAICNGPLVLKKMIKGYGGAAVQACSFDGEEVRVVYGHLKLESITPEQGEMITTGQTIGQLGAGHSEETDGVRKHLHLGIHRGDELDLRGYVKDETEVEQWLDPLKLVQYAIL